MELAILQYEQVAGPLGDKEAIHTIIYYTKMYRLQSLYNYITTYVILFKINKKTIQINVQLIRQSEYNAKYWHY